MKFNPILPILIISLFNTAVYAQSESREGENLNYVDTGAFWYIAGAGNNYDTQGSPFLFDQFSIGHLKQGDKITKNLMIKFNVLEKKVMIVRPFEFDTVYVDQRNLSGFEFAANGKVYDFVLLRANEVKNVPKTGFYEVLYNGKNKLFKEYVKDVVVGDFQGVYSAEKKADKIVDRKPKLFIFTSENELYEVNKKSKDIDEIFGEEMAQYAADNKIKFSKPSQVIRFLEYVDSVE